MSKIDLSTKAILTAVALLLAINFLAGQREIPAARAQDQAARPAFLQVGKSYHFYNERNQADYGKVLSVEENGWVRVSGVYNQGAGQGEFFVNTDVNKIIVPLEDKK